MIYVTFLYDLNKYTDRLSLISDALPHDTQAVVFTKRADPEIRRRFAHLKIVRIGTGFWNSSGFLLLKLLRAVRRLCAQDEVLIHDWFKTFVLCLLVRLKRVYYLYSPVASDYGWVYKRYLRVIPFLGFRYDMRKLLASPADVFIVKRCQKLIVQSRELVEFYNKVYRVPRHKIDYCYNNLKENPTPRHREEDSKTPPASKNRTVVGFVGNLERHKGLYDLERIVRRTDPRRYVYMLVGTVNGRQNRRKLSRIIKYPHVEWVGYRPPEEMRRIYAEIDVMLFLSYHEGSPRVIRETIMDGKPVLTYRHPGLDYCSDLSGVYMFEYGDYEAIIARLLALDGSTTFFPRTLGDEVLANRLKPILLMIASESRHFGG